MKIERKVIPEVPLEEFAERHHLTMQVVERPDVLPGSKMRFYAHFKNAEVMRNGMLEGTHGNGDTEKDAIEDYAVKISCKRLAVNACDDDRMEIEVPRLRA